VTTLTLYVGRDCHLCEIAHAELAALREELGFEVEEVDITGVPELERRYREWLPVIEHEGRRLSVYRVEEQAVREAVGRPGLEGLPAQ
jgi:glutaredoxin